MALMRLRGMKMKTVTLSFFLLLCEPAYAFLGPSSAFRPATLQARTSTGVRVVKSQQITSAPISRNVHQRQSGRATDKFLAQPLCNHVGEAVEGFLQNWSTNIVSFPVGAAFLSFPSGAEFAAMLQQLGEALFISLLGVGFLQGGLAVLQYRTNPRGELMVPPGPTIGAVLPDQSSNATKKESSILVSKGIFDDMLVATENAQWADQNQEETGSTSRSGKIVNQVNKFMLVLLPWLGRSASLILQRNSHLLHIGSILTLTGMFDVPQSFVQRLKQAKGHVNNPAVSFSKGQSEHVLVIGDSLAVGLGSVDCYDMNKTNDWPFQRIENVGNWADGEIENFQPGPAFPKALAQTLANKLQKSVTWRSAGVDGGNVPKIHQFCIGIIDEDLEVGLAPDIVVILCGANDMKYCLSNPLDRSNWPRSFRARLRSLIEDIKAKVPEATVVVPAIPTQMFHKNSPLNVFPLGLLLDIVVGFWDSQKKLVVNSFGTEAVQYIGLSPGEVNQWYCTPSGDMDHDDADNFQGPISLLAIDGVHPNARCYTKWAAAIGSKLLGNSPNTVVT